LREMGEAVHKTGNGVLIDKYAQKTALRLGVSPDAVRTEFKKMSRGKAPAPETGEPPGEDEVVAQRPSNHESWLLKLLLTNDDLAAWAAAHLELNWVEHSLVRQLVSRRLAAQTDQTWSSLAAFLGQCETPEMQNLVAEAASADRPVPDPAQQLADVTLRLRNQFIDRQLGALMQRINQPETTEAERDQLLRQQQDLRSLKRQPLTTEP
jgi:hypothetical protein